MAYMRRIFQRAGLALRGAPLVRDDSRYPCRDTVLQAVLDFLHAVPDIPQM